MLEIREYVAPDGRSPYARWFDGLDPVAANRVAIAVTRMARGSLGNVKSVGGGVLEYRIDFGPGYRIYFGKDGDEIVILLGGGTKKRQQDDIAKAQYLWLEYRRRKRSGV